MSLFLDRCHDSVCALDHVAAAAKWGRASAARQLHRSDAINVNHALIHAPIGSIFRERDAGRSRVVLATMRRRKSPADIAVPAPA
jgi:hypothetical protein